MKNIIGLCLSVCLLAGCVYAPHPVEALHNFKIYFKSSKQDSTKISITNAPDDSLCVKPITQLWAKNGDTVFVPGMTRVSNWKHLFHIERGYGFGLCLEQGGKKYSGARFFYKRDFMYAAIAKCEISDQSIPLDSRSLADIDLDSMNVCSMAIKDLAVLYRYPPWYIFQ